MKKIELEMYDEEKLRTFLEMAMLKSIVGEVYPNRYIEIVFDTLKPSFVARLWQELCDLENKGFTGILQMHFFLKETAEDYLDSFV